MKRFLAPTLILVACLVSAYAIVRPTFATPPPVCGQLEWNACYSACYAAVPTNCAVTSVSCLGADETGLLSCDCALQCQAGGMAGWHDPDHTAGPRHMMAVTEY